MCRVLVFFINGYLRILVDGQLITIRGETIHVPNSTESWERILEIANSDLNRISIKVIYDEWNSDLVTNGLSNFFEAYQVRLESMEELYLYLLYATGETEHFLGHLMLKREGNGKVVAIDTDGAEDRVSFDDIFNVSDSMQGLMQKYVQLNVNNRKLVNKLKKLQKLLSSHR